MLNDRNKKLNRIRMNSDTTHNCFFNLNLETQAFNMGINYNSGESNNLIINNINNKTVVLAKKNSNINDMTQFLTTLKTTRERPSSCHYKIDTTNNNANTNDSNYQFKNIKIKSPTDKINYYLPKKKHMKKAKSFDNFIFEKHKQNFIEKTKDNKKRSNFFKLYSHFCIDLKRDRLMMKKNTKISIKYLKKKAVQENQSSDISQLCNHYKKLNLNNPSNSGNNLTINKKTSACSEVKKKNHLSQNSIPILNSQNEKVNFKSNIIDVNKSNFKNISPLRPSSMINNMNLNFNYASKIIFKAGSNLNVEKISPNNCQTNIDANNTNDSKKTINIQQNGKYSNHKANDETNSTTSIRPQLQQSTVGIKYPEREEKSNVSKIIDQLLATGSKKKNTKQENNKEKEYKIDSDLIKINIPNNLRFGTLETSNKSPKNSNSNKLENKIGNIINKKIHLKSETLRTNFENNSSNPAIRNTEAICSDRRNHAATTISTTTTIATNNLVNKINSFPTNFIIKNLVDECSSNANINNIKLEKKFGSNESEKIVSVSSRKTDCKDKMQIPQKNVKITANNYLSNSSNNILKEYMQNTKLFLNKKNIVGESADNSSFQINSSNLNQQKKIVESNQFKKEQIMNSKIITIKNPNLNYNQNDDKYVVSKIKNDKIENNIITNLSYDIERLKRSPELRSNNPYKILSRKDIIDEETIETVSTPQTTLDNYEIKIDELSDLSNKLENKVFSPFIKPKFVSDSYILKKGESTPEGLINKSKSKMIEKFLSLDLNDENIQARPLVAGREFLINKKSGDRENLSERKTIRMINNTIQLNNFQQIINNNLTYFNNNCGNSKNNSNSKNLFIEEDREEKLINRNDLNSFISSDNKMIIEGGNLSSILNKTKEKLTLNEAREFIIAHNEELNKNYYINTNSTITTVNENIFDRTLLIDNKKLHTPKDILLSHNSICLDQSDDECTFSGDEKAQITSVPLFNNKKLESYNFSINKYSRKFLSNKKIINKFIQIKSFYTLLKYNTEIKESILSYLNYQDLINLSLTSVTLRKEIKNKIYSFIMNLILNENSSITRIKIWQSIFKYSPLSKIKYLKKEYFDYLYRKSPYEDDIKKDLNRTFPDDSTFKQGKMNYRKLFNILVSYSNYNPNVGYAQGLNFIVGNCIFILKDEEEIFLFIDGIIHKFEFQNLIGIDNSMLSKKLDDIGELLKIYTPGLVSFLDQFMLNHEFFTANWLITLFSNSVKRVHVFKIWDFFLIYGWKFFNYFIVSILITFQNEIIRYDPSKLSSNIKLLLKSDMFDQSFKHIILRTMEMINTY